MTKVGLVTNHDFVYVRPLMNNIENTGADVQHSFSEFIDLVTLQHNDIQLVSFVYGVCHCERVLS